MRRWACWLLVVVLITLGLGAWRREVIGLPPYEDQAVGLWNEADFLVETGFDYYRLRYEEPAYMSAHPGARSYVISVLPTLVALLMQYAPDAQTSFVVAHWATFAVVAITLCMVYRCAVDLVGRWGAVAVCLAVLTTPLFSTQVEMVGMDVPLTLPAVLSAVAVTRQRFVAAAGWSAVAFAMKATGSLLTLATLAYLALLWISGAHRASGAMRRRWTAGVAANAAVLLAQTAIVAVGDPSAQLRAAIAWPSILRLPYAVYWCPDMVALLGLAAVASLVLAVGWWRRVTRDAVARGAMRERPTAVERFGAVRPQLAAALQQRAVVFYGWIFLLGMLSANALYIFIPRYFTSAVPLVFLVLAGLVGTSWRGRAWFAGAMVLLVGFNGLNQRGRFFPDMARAGAADFATYAWLHPRQCALSERSRQYLADHRANLEAAARLERQCGDDPIFVTTPHRFYLTKPRLGYVTRRLAVYDVINYETAIPNFRRAMAEHKQPARGTTGALPRPIFLWTGKSRLTVPPLEPGDEVIYEDDLQPPLRVYRKTLPDDCRATPDDWERWYLDRSWPGPWLVDRLESRAAYLTHAGHLDRAMREAIEAVRQRPLDRTLRRVRRLVFDLWQQRRRQRLTAARGTEPPEAIDAGYPVLVRVDARLVEGLKTLEITAGSGAATATGTGGQTTQNARHDNHDRGRPSEESGASRPGHSNDIRKARQGAMLANRADAGAANRTGQREATCGYEMAREALVAGEWERALLGLAVEQVAPTAPLRDGLSRLAWAALLEAQGRTQTAAAVHARVAREMPFLPEAHYRLGLSLLAAGHTQEASEHFLRALSLWPAFAAAHRELAVSLARQGRWNAARRHLIEALWLAPEDRAARDRLLRVVCLQQLGRAARLNNGDGRPGRRVAALRDGLRPRNQLRESR